MFPFFYVQPHVHLCSLQCPWRGSTAAALLSSTHTPRAQDQRPSALILGPFAAAEPSRPDPLMVRESSLGAPQQTAEGLHSCRDPGLRPRRIPGCRGGARPGFGRHHVPGHSLQEGTARGPAPSRAPPLLSRASETGIPHSSRSSLVASAEAPWHLFRFWVRSYFVFSINRSMNLLC